MYSQCPECQARFRVTADDLRAARGTVRCGRCGSAFDALAQPSDTIPPASEPSLAGRMREDVALLSVTPDAVATTEYHFSADDLEKVFIDARDWQKQFGAGGLEADSLERETEPAGTGAEPPVVEVDENEGVEDITLEGERIRIELPAGFDTEEHELDSTDEFEVLQDVPGSVYVDEEVEIERAARPESMVPGRAVEPPLVARTSPSAAPSSLAAQRWRREPDELAAESAQEDEQPAGSGLRVLAWTLGSLALALALLAQLTHHFRQDLVRHPLAGPPLRAAYERLGLPLSPDWDLAAFELRQWGNDSAAATDGRMNVRASLTNRAAFAQPHPVLRLELEDRFGEPVAVRDFEPGEYLKDPSRASRMMGAGATTEAELLIADPGRDAVGYRLDICVRESTSLLRCAQGRG